MSAERHQQIEDIFLAALELSGEERVAFLDMACTNDESLRREVESLLDYKEKPESPLKSSLVDKAVRLLGESYDESLVGKTLGHFKILLRLGAGGMAEVYLAEDVRLNRRVALKLLPSVFTGDETQVHRFGQEAHAASALNHPNIITIHEIGQADSLHYIAMEFIQGETLRQHLHGGRLPLREALGIATQVVEALSAAHRAGIVHRDIKPENVMVRDDGYVKVLDFGIAKLKEPKTTELNAEISIARGATRQRSAAWGTVGYISPEQARGESLDARTDLFSLGILLYEMVSGHRPFDREGKTDSLLDETLAAPLGVTRHHVPRLLEEITNKALKKDRHERYQTAREMLADLERLKRQLESSARGEELAYSSGPSESLLPPVSNKDLSWHDFASLKTLRRHSTWIVIAVALSVVWVVFDLLLRHPHAPGLIVDVTLLVVAAGGVFAFAYSRRRIAQIATSAPTLGAFRGLAAFDEADRDRFYGREADISALVEMIAREESRFGVLYGESGSGKTSVLEAGLIPRLRDEGYLPLYCRSHKEPLAAILAECHRQSVIRCGDAEEPASYLERVARKLDQELVFICDQFEEFFVNFRTKREREPFVSFVADCHRAAYLPVKFLFSIRSDCLYLLPSEFDSLIAEPLMADRRYHLHSFDEEQAEDVIAKSARSALLPLEPALCRQVAHDLAGSESVLPSELQIVGTQLQRRSITSVEDYRRAGGKEQLVQDFLEDVIRATGDQLSARLLLRSLISDENTRLTLSLKEMVRRTQRSQETVVRLLNVFVDSRLIRAIQDEELWRYELMHDYLIELVNRSTGKVMDATQRANRLFRQYLSSYSMDAKIRVPLSKLWLIRCYSDLERGERERELFRKSLRWGLIKTATVIVLLAGATTLAAAALSVREDWEGLRLSDGHTAAVRRAVFSPDGHLIVSVGEDKKVIVWDFVRRERLATLADHTDWITSVDFSPDGRWFATGSRDKTVIVWDAQRFERFALLREHQAPVNAVAFTPDSKFLASASESPDFRTVLWSVGTFQKVRDFPCGSNYQNLRFSPNGRWLLGSSCTSTWDVNTGQLATVEEQYGGNWSSLSTNGSRLVSVGSGGDVFFFDMSEYWHKTKQRLLSHQEAHQDNGRAVAYSPDGRLVATGADDIILWDAATQTKLARLEHTAIVWSLAFSPDGRWLVSTHGDGAILMWDVKERALAADFNEHGAPVRAVAFSSDGKRIASGGEDHSVIIWDTEHGSEEAVLLGHSSRIVGIAFLRDEESVVSCDLRGNVIVWDIRRRQPRLTFNSPGGDSYGLAISPDGHLVANSHGVFEIEKGHQLVDFISGIKGIRGELYGVAFSPDGRLLAGVTEYGQIFLWNATNWRLVDQLELTTAQLISVSFSPDGKWLATGEDEGTVRLWNVNPLRQAAVIGHHTARIKSVAFSPDGKRIASAGDDQTIALWDVQRRSLITHIGTHSAPVLSVAFSPDGKRLVSGEHDKSVRLYTRHRSIWGYRLD